MTEMWCEPNDMWLHSNPRDFFLLSQSNEPLQTGRLHYKWVSSYLRGAVCDYSSWETWTVEQNHLKGCWDRSNPSFKSLRSRTGFSGSFRLTLKISLHTLIVRSGFARNKCGVNLSDECLSQQNLTRALPRSLLQELLQGSPARNKGHTSNTYTRTHTPGSCPVQV